MHLARLSAVVVGAGLAVASIALAAPKPAAKGPPPPDAGGPPTSIKSGARIARVRIEVSPGGASIAHDLIFPKDALAIGAAGEPTLFVAFTAQARPLAIEATKHVLDGNGAIVDTGSTKLEVIDVAVKPKSAALLLGPAVQAGHVIRLPRDGAAFGLRIRSAIPTQEIEKSIAIMARLGQRDQKPMPLESIEVGTTLGASIRGARAVLCGKSADPRPLTLSFVGYPSPTGDAGTISPTAALRTVDDDLCVDVLL